MSVDLSINNLTGTFSQLPFNYKYQDLNKFICIDPSESRIGINTLYPEYSIDISKINNKDGILTNYLDATILKLHNISNDILSKIQTDISQNNKNVFINGDLEINGNLKFKNDASFSALYISGEFLYGVSGSNNHIITSDDRMKHNEQTIVNGLEIINQLNPQFYQKTTTFKDPDFSGILNEPYNLEAGFIAQEVLEIDDISFTVSIGNESKPYGLNYNNLFIYKIVAIKELYKKILDQKQKISLMEEEIQAMINK